MSRGKRLFALIAIACSLILAAVPIIGQVSPVQAAGPPWTKSAEEVTLENERYVLDCWVVRDGSTYRMWYTHVKTDLSLTEIVDGLKTLGLGDIIDDIANLNLNALLNHLATLAPNVNDIVDFLGATGTVIGYATSTDGIEWTIVNSEALVGGGGELWNSVGAPCVIWDEGDGVYKMWYTRLKTDLIEADLADILDDLDGNEATRKAAILDLLDSISTVIGYATSTNGEDWIVLPGNDEVWAGDGTVFSSVGDPCVILDDGTYKMWYTRLKTDLTEANLDDILTNIGDFSIDALLDILDGTATVIGYTTSSDGVNWAPPNPEVLPGSTAAWDSVANPSVVKTGNTYEMWYTNITTDLTATDLQNLATEIVGLDIPGLLNIFDPADLDPFLDALASLNIDKLKALLSDTSTVIGYATSDDGEHWTVDNPEDLVGSSSGLWSSVGAPSVVKTGSTYEMWYTKGIDDLTLSNVLDMLLGTTLPIGYAYYIPAAPGPGPGGGGGGGGGAGKLTLEVTMDEETSYHFISSEGKIKWAIEVTSEDGQLSVLIAKGAIALDKEGNPLTSLKFIADETPPPPPSGANIIGTPYNFEPDGATFAPSISIIWSYDETEISPGGAEENLVIAHYDEALHEWVTCPCTCDPVADCIEGCTCHLTTFAIIAYAAPPPPPPSPAAFITSSLSISPRQVNISKPVTISVLVTNIGEEAGSYTVTFEINGVVEETRRVTLAGGANETVTFTTSKDKAGTYSVTVNGITGSFTVMAVPPPPLPTPAPAPAPPAKPSWWLIGGIIAAVVAAIAVPLTLRWRQRRELIAKLKSVKKNLEGSEES